ncbi:MAG: hypothetical protein JWO63_2176 [Frankiales bacterium]|jgi:hypothetical protein|nr:hypothetical protein [Frankiales bacterium]
MLTGNDGNMTACRVLNCKDPADGRFLAAPKAIDDNAWPVHEAHIELPLPLCHWHSLIFGGPRVNPDARPTPAPAA